MVEAGGIIGVPRHVHQVPRGRGEAADDVGAFDCCLRAGGVLEEVDVEVVSMRVAGVLVITSYSIHYTKLYEVYEDSLARQPEIFFEAGDHENLVHMQTSDYLSILRGCGHGNFCEPL